MENEIKRLLATIVHPETGDDLVAGGMVEHIAATADKATVVLRFARARDPFAAKLKTQAERLL
ncbi:MAG: iron-sulfur cluster assembly protein, partial [Alistipes sp.]|nr:iron-sulfur cluster assembly protein [Alistipes sp.]